jgi:hypothetical protein
MPLKATAAPGAHVTVQSRDHDPHSAPDNRVHLIGSGHSGNVTLCGCVADYHVTTPQPSSARVSCYACLNIVRHVQRLRVRITGSDSDA